LLGSEATLSQNSRQLGDADMPKPRRSRALALTRVDRRLPLGRRGSLDDIMVAERRADLAVRAIGLPKERPRPTASVTDILKRVNKDAPP
jgi:hypothetical protein